MSYIAAMIPKENYQLEVLLDNDSSVILNLKGKLNTVRFGRFSDPEFFNGASTDGVCPLRG